MVIINNFATFMMPNRIPSLTHIILRSENGVCYTACGQEYNKNLKLDSNYVICEKCKQKIN